MSIRNMTWKIPLNEILVQPNSVYIWVADLLRFSSKYLEHLKQFLSQDELAHARNYKFEVNKNYYITARAILRRILGYYLAINPQEISFSYNDHGKPYLNPKFKTNKIKFNVSHSGDLVLYIFSVKYDVGIDLERVMQIEDFLDIAKTFFSFSEYSKLTAIPDNQQLKAFYCCWTRKEAFIKAMGNGLNYPLNQFEVTMDPNKPAKLLAILGNHETTEEWCLHSFKPKPGYEAAFAVRGQFKEIEYLQFIEQLL